MKLNFKNSEMKSNQGSLGLENPWHPYVTKRFFLIHARSERQLPTEIDYVGEPKGRSTNIRMINRRYSIPGCFLFRYLYFISNQIYEKYFSKEFDCKHLTGHSISGVIPCGYPF